MNTPSNRRPLFVLYIDELSAIALKFLNRLADKWMLFALFMVIYVPSRFSPSDFLDKAGMFVLGALVNMLVSKHQSAFQNAQSRYYNQDTTRTTARFEEVKTTTPVTETEVETEVDGIVTTDKEG